MPDDRLGDDSERPGKKRVGDRRHVAGPQTGDLCVRLNAMMAFDRNVCNSCQALQLTKHASEIAIVRSRRLISR
jgi:hypothetical protein